MGKEFVRVERCAEHNSPRTSRQQTKFLNLLIVRAF